MQPNLKSSWFQRLLLPSFAFKAVVIGGGYATGRELAEFFMPSGPWGGILGMLLSAVIWSVVCTVTFLFARATSSLEYRQFFRQLLGRFWFVFEIAFILMAILILAVFGAAAGAIGHAIFNWPLLLGTLLLMGTIAGFAAFGNRSVEQLFKYVTLLLYGVYAIFLLLAVTHFGGRIATSFAKFTPGTDWIMGGITYAGYNLFGAVAILPMLRHLRSNGDALIAGMLCGPLAMGPAILFFVCMAAWPEVKDIALPSDYLLGELNFAPFHFLFQFMIFAALVESGTGIVHAINQRIAATAMSANFALPQRWRLMISLVLLTLSIFIADRFGLVSLIARGYRALAFVLLSVFVLPLFTIGVLRLVRIRRERVLASLSTTTSP